MTTPATSSTDADANVQAALAAMNSGTNFFDVTIICCTDDHQAAYWMDRFSGGLLKKKKEGSPYPMVLAVSEDWNAAGGAGNGLGTVYAFQKAAALAKELYGGVDLKAELSASNVSAALYHTAGKGTRLAPMPASENNNKPGVKLPFPLDSSSPCQPLTVLEAVVKQTGIYAAARKGRLSVFWGDQVFLPSASFAEEPTHHADILCTLGDSAPSPEEWADRGLEKYGVIACIGGDGSSSDNGGGGRMEAAQLEKVSHGTAVSMLESLGSLKQVGPSLGSFSVSAAFLQALAKEFDAELKEKTAKLDTDPHFWMPLTLPEASYVKLMEQKGTPADESKKHYARMAAMKASFDLGSLGLFGAVNVGQDACWWDYGLLKLYSKNSLLLLEQDSKSAALLRQFLGVDAHQVDSEVAVGTTVDDASYLFATTIKTGGTVRNSLLTAVTAGEVDVDGAIVVNCAAKKITAKKGAILYNLVDDSEGGIVAGEGQVMVAVTDESGASTLLQSRMDVDGGTAWKVKLDYNELSFEDVHKKNKDANIQEIAKKRQENYDKVAASI